MATVEELRQSLGEVAKEPMIALQLAELGRVEQIRDLIFSSLNDGTAGDNGTAEYAKYNQRHNDTIKTLMAMLKIRLKNIAKEPDSPYTKEQADLVGIADAGQSGNKKKTKS